MSRRKQSCPKPIKRETEEELDELARKLSLPCNILSLRTVESSPRVFTSLALPAGSSFGPFKASFECPPDPESHAPTIELPPTEGRATPRRLYVLTESGAWLSLLQLRSDANDAKVSLSLDDGGVLWCEINESVPEDVCLLGHLSFENRHQSPRSGATSPQSTTAPPPAVADAAPSQSTAAPPRRMTSRDNNHTPSAGHASAPSDIIAPVNSFPLIYDCPHCGVKFSNPSTLEAHVTFYCTKKADSHTAVRTPYVKSAGSSESRLRTPPPPPLLRSPVTPPPPAVKRSSSESPPTTPAKHAKTSQMFSCLQCPYSTDKRTSWLAHAKQHEDAIEAAAEVATEGPSDESMFCADCNIQFSSPRTLRAHKDFYCKSRRQQQAPPKLTVGSGGRTHVGDSPMPLPMSHSAMIVPILTPQGVSTVIIPPVFVSSSADHHPVPLPPPPLDKLPPHLYPESKPCIAHESTVVSAQVKREESTADLPLDLSIRNKDETDNLSSRSPGRVTPPLPPPNRCSPSGRSVGQQRSPIQSRRSPAAAAPRSPGSSRSPRPTGVRSPARSSPSILAGRKTHDATRHGATEASLAAAISRCDDCNIFFYKHENFVVHKEHYCAGRQRLGQPQASRASSTSPRSDHRVSPRSRTPAEPSDPKAYFCLPCKIRFSNVHNLSAHQSFYCPARPRLHAADKTTPPPPLSQPQPALSPHRTGDCSSCTRETDCGEDALLRCPYCVYVTQSDSRLHEHVKAHSPTRAFKCQLCGYRGNTMRGMRIHGKTHSDSGEAFPDNAIVEFERPALIPPTGLGVSDSTDLQTDLLRLKNEPYKRRRSRKLFEKVEVIRPYQCIVCSCRFAEQKQLQEHVVLHVGEQSKLREATYESQVEIQPTVKREMMESSENWHTHLPNNEQTNLVMRHSNESVRTKMEELDTEHTNIMTSLLKEENGLPAAEELSPEIRIEPNENGNSLTENIKLEKHSASPVSMESGVNSDKENNEEIDVEREDSDSDSCIPTKEILKKNGLRLMKIKEEQLDTNENQQSIETIAIKSELNVEMEQTAAKFPELTASIVAGKNKYCMQCDISFTHMSTFLAHKKYYCSSHGRRPTKLAINQA